MGRGVPSLSYQLSAIETHALVVGDHLGFHLHMRVSLFIQTSLLIVKTFAIVGLLLGDLPCVPLVVNRRVIAVEGLIGLPPPIPKTVYVLLNVVWALLGRVLLVDEHYLLEYFVLFRGELLSPIFEGSGCRVDVLCLGLHFADMLLELLILLLHLPLHLQIDRISAQARLVLQDFIRVPASASSHCPLLLLLVVLLKALARARSVIIDPLMLLFELAHRDPVLADRNIQVLLLINRSSNQFTVVAADRSRADSRMFVERRGATLLRQMGSMHLFIPEIERVQTVQMGLRGIVACRGLLRINVDLLAIVRHSPILIRISLARI